MQVCTHGIQRALSRPSSEDSAHRNEGCGKRCDGCLFVDYFMSSLLPTAIEASRTPSNAKSVDDALRYMGDSLVRFHLYQGHRIRVCNQQLAIAKIEEELKNEVLQNKISGSSAVLTIDWKMKFNKERSRESSIHNYGKRGIAWHEAVLTYYVWSHGSQSAERVQLSFDQILGTGNKQDGLAVLSMVEALLVKVKSELPHITRIAAICSDNAACYHRKELIFAIPILNKKLKSLTVDRLIHTETQDGKGACDSHGAISHRHVQRNFLRAREEKTETKKVCTPRNLAEAISCKGGVQNNGTFSFKDSFPFWILIVL